MRMKFTPEYLDFNANHGCTSYGTVEVYGFSDSDGLRYNAYMEIGELITYAEEDNKGKHHIPSDAIPLVGLGDGDYYLYLNNYRKVIGYNINTQVISQVKNVATLSDVVAYLNKLT